MKTLMTLILFLLAQAAAAETGAPTQQTEAPVISPSQLRGFDLQAGSMAGESVDRKRRVSLMTRSIPGREGSLVGVLNEDSGDHTTGETSFYVIDPLFPNTYALYPLSLSEDGLLKQDFNPSLTLSISGTPNRMTLIVTSANSGNEGGVQGSYRFYSWWPARMQWLDLVPGDYRYEKRDGNDSTIRRAANISPLAVDSEMTTGIFTIPNWYEAKPAIHETQYPGLYSFSTMAVVSTGMSMDPVPKAIGVFYKWHNWLGFGGIYLKMQDKAEGAGNTRILKLR